METESGILIGRMVILSDVLITDHFRDVPMSSVAKMTRKPQKVSQNDDDNVVLRIHDQRRNDPVAILCT